MAGLAIWLMPADAGNLAHVSGCWQPGSRQRMLATWLTPANQEPSSSAAARAQARRCQPCPLRHNRGLAPQRSGHCRTARRHRAQDTRNTHTPDYQAQIRRSRQPRTQAQGIQSPQQWPGQRSAHDNGRRIWGLRHIVVARRTLSRPPAAIALALLVNRQKSPARNRPPETARSPPSSQSREKHRSAICAGPCDIAAMNLQDAESIKPMRRTPPYPSAYGG